MIHSLFFSKNNTVPIIDSLSIEKLYIEMKNFETSETKSSVPLVDYPVRIHATSTCCCTRIKSKFDTIKLQEGEQITHVVEKIWDDPEYKSKPKHIYLTQFSGIIEDKLIPILNHFFRDSDDARKFVNEYFSKYNWFPSQSIEIRKIVNKLTSICYCVNNLIVDTTTCNAGFVIIGSNNQTKYISNFFNKNVTKTEFSEMFHFKLSALQNIDGRKIGHCLQKFMHSREFHFLKKNNKYYTLTGLLSTTYLKGKDPTHNLPVGLSPNSGCQNQGLDLPFGKREWCFDLNETSFECAKRELYEEFNIQFSSSIWKYSTSNNMPAHIHYPGFMLYFLYLPTKTFINYHSGSETILIDTAIGHNT